MKQPSSILVSIFSVNVFFFSSSETELKRFLSLQRYLATRCQKYSVESGERKAKRGGTKLQQYLDSSQALSAACEFRDICKQLVEVSGQFTFLLELDLSSKYEVLKLLHKSPVWAVQSSQ